MVESAGGRGEPGRGRPPPAGSVNFPQRARPASCAPPPLLGPGRSHGFPKRRNEVRFLGRWPLVAEAACRLPAGKPASRSGRAGGSEPA